VTLLGRVRRVPELCSQSQWLRNRAERQVFNSLIQGGAADLMKLGIIDADRLLAERVPEAFLSLTVHDELVALAPERQAEAVKGAIVEAMTGPDIQALLRVRLDVDTKVCQRWSQAK